MQMFATNYTPPEKRQRYTEGGIEVRLTEAAVMIAYAFHLFDQAKGPAVVHVHPDGEHAKVFEITPFLEAQGFRRTAPLGSTSYGGRYERGDQVLIVNPASGRGDVVGEVDGVRLVAECKGGCINSTHAGQKSRLRRGICELVGQLMLLPTDGSRQVAVLPSTPETKRLAAQLALRCKAAGLEIALVERSGVVRYATPRE